VQLGTAAGRPGSSFRHLGRGQDPNTLQISASVKSIKIGTTFPTALELDLIESLATRSS
jgi:hypothetical protein